jgi:hypothetical protein
MSAAWPYCGAFAVRMSETAVAEWARWSRWNGCFMLSG